MPKREDAPPPGALTRLVYSTDGTVPATVEKRRTGGARQAPPARGPSSGGGKGIRVRLERRPGGRDVTTVLGVPGPAEAIATLARDLRAACGAGGTVRDGIIELQGDQCDKVRAVLTAKGMKAR